MILFENAKLWDGFLWDGFADTAMLGTSVLVEGELIREIAPALASTSARRVDLACLSLLTGQGAHLAAILKAGRFVKDHL